MASIISAGTTSGTSLNLSGDTSGVLQLASNGSTTAVTINTSQNVGIGTGSPAYALDVRSTAAPAIRLSRSGTAGQIASMVFEDGNATLGSGSTTRVASDAGAMSFSTGGTSGAVTGGTERMRIDSSGNVGIGTSTPGQKLAVVGDTYVDTQLGVAAAPVGASGIKISAGLNSGDGGNPRSCILCNTNQSPASNPFILFTNLSNNTAGSITHTGTTTVAYNTSSDYRLKENIAPMTGALAKVAALKPCTYTWKEDGTDGQGFIAHELQEVISDCVSGEKDAVETYTDEDGNEQTRIKPQGVDTSFLVATLTAAIQELKAELDATKAEVQALKGTL